MFGVTVLLLFLLNLEPSRKKLAGLSIVLGFFLFWLFFEGSVIPMYATL
jgi:NADH:ubiquinone oxidoreductase subunit 4 (subunit M)